MRHWILQIVVTGCLLACSSPARKIELPPATKVIAPDGQPNDHFGRSVDYDGERMIVGAEGDDERFPEAGSAYIFAKRGKKWELEDKVVANDARTSARFGTSVSILGSWSAVSARGNID